MRAVFNDFNVDLCCDRFKIYNGLDTSYPLLYNSLNNPNAPTAFASTDISGALTFKFTSNDATTFSGWDATIFCEPLPSSASTPSGMHANVVSSNGATVAWYENSGTVSWEIELVPNNTNPTGNGNIVNINSYNFSQLTPNSCYDFYVRSLCSEGVSAWTQKYTICTEPDYCDGTYFYDSGGANANYHNDEDKITVIYPGTEGDHVTAIFNS